MPTSAAAMQAETTGEDPPPEPAGDPADAPPAPSDLAVGQQSAHTMVLSKHPRDSDTGRPVPAAARASRDSLPSISEDLDAASTPLAAAKPITTGGGSAQKATFGRDGNGHTGLARLPSSWGSRASEASSATVLRAPSTETTPGAGGAGTSDRPAPPSRASVYELAPVPPDSAAAAAGGPGLGATKPPVPRLSSLGSGGGSSRDVRPGGKLPGPLLSHSSSNATGGVASSAGNSAGSLAGSSAAGSSASALPKAIDAVLATGIRPKAADEGTADRDIAGHRADQLPGQAPGPTRNDDKERRQPAHAGLLGVSSGDNTCGAAAEAGTELRPLAPSKTAELRALPPSALEARVEQAARLYGPRAPQVCC